MKYLLGINTKNKIMRLVLFLTVPLVFFSCNNLSNKEGNSDLKILEYPVELDIETLINRKAKLLSFKEIIDTIEYVPLETKDECLIGRIRIINFNNDNIFIGQGYDIFQFSGGGNFIRKVGQQGRGPGEYMQLRDMVLINDTLYINGRHKAMLFNSKGELRNEISIPLSIYFGKINNYYVNYNTDTGEIEFFTETGTHYISRLYDHNHSFEPLVYMIGYWDETIFIRNGTDLFIHENYNDTVLLIKSPHDINPYYIFNMGKYKLPDEFRYNNGPEKFEELTREFFRRAIYETNNYLFIKLSRWFPTSENNDVYLCVFDKRKGELFLVTDDNGNTNFKDFYPVASYEDYLLFTIDAYKTTEYSDKFNPGTSFEEITNNMSENDNPLVIKMKLK